jgi:hypothetical protein
MKTTELHVAYWKIFRKGPNTFKVYYNDGFDTGRDVYSLHELREESLKWSLDEEDTALLTTFLRDSEWLRYAEACAECDAESDDPLGPYINMTVEEMKELVGELGD